MKFCKATKNNLQIGTFVQRRNGRELYGEILEVSFLAGDENFNLKDTEVICRSPSGDHKSVKEPLLIQDLAKVLVEECNNSLTDEESMAEYFQDLIEQENDLRARGIIK